MKKYLLFTLLALVPMAASVLVGCGGGGDERGELKEPAPSQMQPGQKPEGQR